MKDYPKEELQELYQGLPEDLQKALFSNEVGENVQRFCDESDIVEEEIPIKILKLVGYVFLGILDPTEFSESLTEEGIKDAKIIADKINNEVFMRTKDSLEILYDIKLNLKKIEEKKKEPRKADKYLESIE